MNIYPKRDKYPDLSSTMQWLEDECLPRICVGATYYAKVVLLRDQRAKRQLRKFAGRHGARSRINGGLIDDAVLLLYKIQKNAVYRGRPAKNHVSAVRALTRLYVMERNNPSKIIFGVGETLAPFINQPRRNNHVETLADLYWKQFPIEMRLRAAGLRQQYWFVPSMEGQITSWL